MSLPTQEVSAAAALETPGASVASTDEKLESPGASVFSSEPLYDHKAALPLAPAESAASANEGLLVIFGLRKRQKVSIGKALI